MDVQLLETCLLVGRWDDQLNASLGTYTVAKLAKAVVDGDFRTVLTSTYAQEVFGVNPSVAFEEPYERLLRWTLPSVSDAHEQELARLVLGVACLHAFVQTNWTGPDLDLKPSDILVFPNDTPGSISDPLLHSKAVAELAYGGEPAYHLARSAALLRFAQILLDVPHVHLIYTPWWRLRTSIVHQHVLDEAVPLPSTLLASLASLVGRTSSDPDLTGRLLLEQGLLEHLFSHDKSAADHFVRAARATGLQYELTGALGKRTKFQQNALSQLVLLAESRWRDGEDIHRLHERASSADAHISRSVGSVDGSHAHVQDGDGSEGGETGPKKRTVPETLPLNDDTLLEQTEFTSSNPSTTDMLRHLDPSSQPPLHPLDQCILLSLCLNVRNTSPSHGLTNEQMSPYVARVISHPRNWSVHTMALLLRSRLESTRTRTVERSTLQLQALVDQMPTADSELSERLLYFHAIPLPSMWEMERELALRYLSIGVVKSALEIFERLEMWEEVVQCWQSMERRDQAIVIVRDLLQGRKEEAESVIARGKDVSLTRRSTLDSAREAKLWCLLGDLEPEHAVAHYERAWAVSKDTSGRAMRSLGGYYFARGEFENAVSCLLKAVAINPLLSRPWFILGCTYIRMEKWEGARDAFSRCVAIDDEDAESWNNLATIYLRLDDQAVENVDDINEPWGTHAGNDDPKRVHKKSVSFSNKTLAFRALKQGLKYRYENWQMWSNYMIVAMDVGELSEACRAQARIVEERATKVGAECVDEAVLARLVDAVTREPVDDPEQAKTTGVASDSAQDADVMRAAARDVGIMYPNEGRGLLGRVLDLFERTILPRVSAPSVFRAYARLLTYQTRWEDAVKAYLDGYRCSAAGTFDGGDTDVDKWREAVGEVHDIVDVLRNFGPRVGGFNWRHQGRSILRTFIGRSRDYQDEPEWCGLLEIQEELRKEE